MINNFTVYYYVLKNKIYTDVFISNKGEYINSRGDKIHIKRASREEFENMISTTKIFPKQGSLFKR